MKHPSSLIAVALGLALGLGGRWVWSNRGGRDSAKVGPARLVGGSGAAGAGVHGLKEVFAGEADVVDAILAAKGLEQLLILVEWLPKAGPAEFDRLLDGLPRWRDGRLHRQAVYLRWTALDPEVALGSAKRREEDFAWWAWGVNDPDRAWSAARSAAVAPGDRQAVLAAIAESDPLRVQEVLKGDPSLHGRSVAEAIAEGLSRHSLEAAASFAAKIQPEWSKLTAPNWIKTKPHERLIRDFVRADPDGAMQWALCQSNARIRADNLSVVFDQLALTRSEVIGQTIEAMPPSRSKERLFSEHAARLAQEDPQAARAWALEADGSEQRNLALGAAAVALVSRDPQAALDLLRAMDLDARPASMRFGLLPGDNRFDVQEENTWLLRHSFASVAEQAPRETWELVQHMAPPTLPDWPPNPQSPMERLGSDSYGWKKVREGVFEGWIRADRTDFSEWLSGQPPSEDRTFGIGRLADSILKDIEPDFSAALQWAAAESGEETALLVRTLMQWGRMDKAAADDALAALRLPPEHERSVRQEVENMRAEENR